MPENKIIPVQIPGYSYNVAPTDIGSGYAAGISSAGKSIAGAISGIMGGVDAAGNVTHGILEQNSTVNDMLGFLKDQGTLSTDAYNNIMGKGLGARQQVVGAMFGQFQTNWQQQLEQRNKLAQIQASGEQQRQTQALSEAETTKRAQAQIDLERQKLLLDPKNRPLTIVE